MRHISTQVPNWKEGKNVPGTITLHSFQLENADRQYSSRLYGFSHGTSAAGLRSILHTGSINCSYNIRKPQKDNKKHTTGGDRGHAGQHTVYFRYVAKKRHRTSVPRAIVDSLGGVGGGEGYVLFVSLEKAVQSGLRFALAGGSDGIGGQNCFTAERMERSKDFFYRRKDMLSKRMQSDYYISDSDSDRTEYERFYSNKEFSEDYLGITQFEIGLSAAQQGGQGNEIGFLGNISLNNVEVIMIRGNNFGTIFNYNFEGPYVKKNANWSVYRQRGSNLQLNL